MGLFFLKEDTAVDTKLGPFVDKGDGVAYEVGMSAAMGHAVTGVRLSKNGAAFADRTEATNPAYDAFGYYLVKLDATDTNTPGRLKVIFGDAAVCLPCEANFQVLHANVFDSLFGAAAADLLDVNVSQWLGHACHAVSENGVPKVDLDQIGGVVQSLTDFKDFVDTGYVPGTHSVALVDTTTTNTDMVGTNNAALASVLGALNNVAADGDPTDVDTLMQYIKQLINILIGTTGIAAFPAEAAPANAVSLAEVIRAIHVDVTGLNGDAMKGTDGANTTVPDAAGVAATPAEVATALTDINLDHLMKTGVANNADMTTEVADGTVLSNILSKTSDTSTFAVADDSLEAVGDRVKDVETDTGELQTDWVNGGRLDLILDSVISLLDDARAEPGQGNPPVNADAMTKLDYLYKWTRNQKDNDGTTTQFYNDAGAVVDHKQTTSEAGGTVTKAEIVTGP